jgi:hypothetical protein
VKKMKKAAYLILVVFALVLIGAFPAEARNGGGGGRGGHSGGPARTQGGGHGGGHRGGHGGGGHFSGSVWIGPGWGWGSWWGWPYYYPYYPYYSYYPYYGGYYYPESPVVIEKQPRTYSEPEQQEEEYYWYFCPDAKNYYPYVKKCPNGWLKVVPSSPPD